MNSIELYGEVKDWLEAEEVSFSQNDEEKSFSFRMGLETGLTQVRVICEEAPDSVQVICTIPIKVPADKIPQAGLLLHNINLRLRIGGFQYLADERVITFRLPHPVYKEAGLREQLSGALATALGTVEGYLPALGLYLCSTKEAQAKLENVLPKEPGGPNNEIRLSASRVELN